ncbi:MAG: tRNA uridine-5-carboxymethylaminomethyl(34) synthesis GTPase MnmE, partial [Candidatus Cloacimonadota bacterium]|nr:tRNA uridine-5-carboxymethylaminomethyl(34) synthesis GTPase MnmE [Candidatus Cloacimonadota bacterium]
GNDFVANMILELFLRKLRLADAGEFTMRAFFNDKMDLTQAEAVGDLLNAKTKHQHQMAIHQLEGSLHNKITKILAKITELRTLLELEIDFQEQGLSKLGKTKFANDIQIIISKLQNLIDNGNDGLILREGYKVSLFGAPNVGKSSIFNKLLESERAIVTPIPGTTRDYIEEAISLNGFYIRFFDTAGIRETSDEIEIIGINRAIDVIKASHKILYIEDGQTSSNLDELLTIVDEDKIIKVLNKSDLHSKEMIDKFNGFVLTSTKTNNGLDAIKQKLSKDLFISNQEMNSGMLTNMRQISAVKKSLFALKKGYQTFIDEMGIEFVAFDLQESSSFLEELIGKVSDEDIRTKIFSEFCVGK